MVMRVCAEYYGRVEVCLRCEHDEDRGRAIIGLGQSPRRLSPTQLVSVIRGQISQLCCQNGGSRRPAKHRTNRIPTMGLAEFAKNEATTEEV